MTKNYLDYGKRLKSLYEQRPYRPLQPQPHYLIGRSSLKEEILSEHVGDVLDISYV